MLDDLLHANERYAEAVFGELPLLPSRGLVILTCMDHRIDPLAALGLEPGDAMVIRNAGGRVTPAFVRDLRILELVADQRGGSLGDLELLLMQHTQCGAGGLAGEHHDLLADHLGCANEELGTRSPADPYEGVRVDIELLAAEDAVPDSLAVTGLVYDVEDGRMELVERRAPLRPE